MNTYDRDGHLIEVGDNLDLVLPPTYPGTALPRHIKGTVKALYSTPAGATLELSHAVKVFDSQLKGLVLRHQGDLLYVSFPGQMQSNGDFICRVLHDDVEYHAVKRT